jgi:GT2 family glycosyltransferase
MIPTHNCAAYLRRTLASVLAQDPGADAMQIEVVDDASTRDDPAAVVSEIGRGRVAFHRNPTNLGATRTFNACLERARGQWVHLLHGDDLVLPGFYAECERAFAEEPRLVMVIGQVILVDEEDRWLQLTGPPAAAAGRVVADFLAQQAVAQIAQFAGVAVRRDAYERTGGFCTLFGHVADRDMWFRVGQLGPVWCTSRPYGLYRIHGGQDTGQQMVRGTNILEFHLATEVNLARLGGPNHREAARAARRALARRAYGNARKLYRRGHLAGSLAQASLALRLSPSGRAAGLWTRAWVRHALAGNTARA